MNNALILRTPDPPRIFNAVAVCQRNGILRRPHSSAVDRYRRLGVGLLLGWSGAVGQRARRGWPPDADGGS